MTAAVTGRRALRWGSWAACAAIACSYAAFELKQASVRPMWLDESYALAAPIRAVGLKRLLVHGAFNQASPSPLDYLLLKGLDRARRTVRYLGLAPHAYFRLIAVMSTVAAGTFALGIGMAASWRARGRPRAAAAAALALCGALAFLLHPYVVHFAVEMRPYALWNALWLVSALSFAGDTRAFRATRSVSLPLLAVTATASVFQLAALAVAAALVEWIGGAPLRRLATRTAAWFALPFALSGYYALQVQSFDYPVGFRPWAAFFGFWSSHWWVGAISAAAFVLCLMKRETRLWAVPPLAMVVLYAMGPAVIWATRLKGFFFTERQYLYYWTAVPIACLACAFAIAVEGGAHRRAARTAVAIGAVLLCIAGTAGSVRRTLPALAEAWPLWQHTRGVPADPEGLLAGLLTREMPRAFCFTSEPSAVALRNIGLVAEWLPVRYPALPVGARTVVLEARGDGAEVRATGTACDSGIAVPVAGDAPR